MIFQLQGAVAQSGVVFFEGGYAAILANMKSSMVADAYIKFVFVGTCHESCSECDIGGDSGCTACKQTDYELKKSSNN